MDFINGLKGHGDQPVIMFVTFWDKDEEQINANLGYQNNHHSWKWWSVQSCLDPYHKTRRITLIREIFDAFWAAKTNRWKFLIHKHQQMKRLYHQQKHIVTCCTSPLSQLCVYIYRGTQESRNGFSDSPTCNRVFSIAAKGSVGINWINKWRHPHETVDRTEGNIKLQLNGAGIESRTRKWA